MGGEVRVLGTFPHRALPLWGEALGGPQGIESRYFQLPRYSLPKRLYHASMHSHYEWPRSKDLFRELKTLIQDWKPDVIHAEELATGAYLPSVQGWDSGALESICLHNVESDLHEKIWGSPLNMRWVRNRHIDSLKKYEEKVVTRVGMRLTYSETDRKRYEVLYPQLNWIASRNGTQTQNIRITPLPSQRSILFLGSMSYGPNQEGVYWFLYQVLPFLDRSQIDQITIAGRGASSDLRDRLRSFNIRYIEGFDQVESVYADHALTMVPLLSGGGTRTKILESIAHGRAVVSTTIGAEGLDEFGADSGLIRVDGPEEFASTLLESLDLGQELGGAIQEGQRIIREVYDWKVVARELKEIWAKQLS